jgi:hypothetical protein
MDTEENKALIRRYFAATDATCQTGNADLIDEFLAPDFVEHSRFPGIPPTRDGRKQVFLMFDAATPGYHVIEDLPPRGTRSSGALPPTAPTSGSCSAFPRRASRSA